jgi:hypothetical protein
VRSDSLGSDRTRPFKIHEVCSSEHRLPVYDTFAFTGRPRAGSISTEETRAAAYNAGPGKVLKLQKRAEERGLNPYVWFNNVEIVAGEWKRMDTVMKKVTKARRLLTLGWLAATIFGCGALQSQPASRIIPISNFEQVAGKWEGLSKRMPDMRDDAQVIVIISKNGHVNFISDRGTEVLLGTGTLTILEGKVFGKTGSGTGTFTLHDKAGNLVLVLEAALNDGNHYFLEMTPMK